MTQNSWNLTFQVIPVKKDFHFFFSIFFCDTKYMSLDFDIIPNGDELDKFTEKERTDYNNDKTNKYKKMALNGKIEIFSHSLDILNKFCKKELIEYRKSLICSSDILDQNEKLNILYKKYKSEMKLKPLVRRKNFHIDLYDI